VDPSKHTSQVLDAAASGGGGCEDTEGQNTGDGVGEEKEKEGTPANIN